MKLSYREKIGLLVFIVAVVIIIFIAWPIKTIKGNIKNHTKEKEEIQVEYDETQRLIAQIPNIEKNITDVYNESKGLNEKFTIKRENFEIDKFMEEIINKAPYKATPQNTLEIKGGFSIEDADAGTLDFYYYTPNVIQYPILEAADVNGNLMETTDKALYEKVINAVAISELEAEEVELHTASVNMRFTKESLLALQDELKEKDTGIRITSVTINDYAFGALAEIPEDSGYSEGSIELSFYTMQQIQEPKFDD